MKRAQAAVQGAIVVGLVTLGVAALGLMWRVFAWTAGI
jgi:hypothetical protein